LILNFSVFTFKGGNIIKTEDGEECGAGWMLYY